MKKISSINKTNHPFRSAGLILCLCLLQAAVAPLHAGDTADNRGQLSSSDYKFAKAAAEGGRMEVDLGKIAAQKSSNPIIQQFGQRMVTDHGKAGDKLKDIASKNGATLPAELSASQRKEVDRLNSLSGDEFDKHYVALMVRDHKKDLKEFQHAAKTAENSELKEFAATTSQAIQEHLTMIEDISKQLSSSKTSASAQ